MAKTKSALQDTYEQLEQFGDFRLSGKSINHLKKIISGEIEEEKGPTEIKTREEMVEYVRSKYGDEEAERYLADRIMREKLHLR